jgi:hypothetical protein
MDSTAANNHIGEALATLKRCQKDKQAALDGLALAILEERERGATVRALAERYDLAPSAVHSWTQRGRSLKQRPSRRIVPHYRVGTPAQVIPTPIQWVILMLVLVCVLLNVVDMVGQV